MHRRRPAAHGAGDGDRGRTAAGQADRERAGIAERRVWLDCELPITFCAVASWLIFSVWSPVAAPLLTVIDNAAEALTSPVELIVAARAAKALVASELMIDELSDVSPEASVLRSVCSAW